MFRQDGRGDDSGWVKCQSKPLQGVLTLSHTPAHKYKLFICPCFLNVSHTQAHFLSVSLSQHSAPPNHYLLVKPMPELGEETKRHWENYYWKELCSSHHMYPCNKNTSSVWVQALRGQSGVLQSGIHVLARYVETIARGFRRAALFSNLFSEVFV